jgi:hypothetical protein
MRGPGRMHKYCLVMRQERCYGLLLQDYIPSIHGGMLPVPHSRFWRCRLHQHKGQRTDAQLSSGQGQQPRPHLEMLAASSAACVATRSLGSCSSSCRARPLTAPFSSSGTLLHSRVPITLRQLAPTEFLATTMARRRVACSGRDAGVRVQDVGLWEQDGLWPVGCGVWWLMPMMRHIIGQMALSL